MTGVVVTFPVLRGANRFLFQIGRRWSVVEHLLLHSAAANPAAASVFAARSGLPRRVVLEAFIRLMRAGWVEMSTVDGKLIFRATAKGAELADYEQLPAATTKQSRWRAYQIEQVTGGVFRTRELDARRSDQLPVSTDKLIVTHLQGSFQPGQDHLSDVFVAIEGEDEEIVGIQRAGTKPSQLYAAVAVHDGVIEGLPARASTLLRARILAQADLALNSRRLSKTEADIRPLPTQANEPGIEPPISRPSLYDAEDLIVDGEAHRRAIERIVRSARERLIIHSTFVTDSAATALLPHLLQAASRGVHIDLLWGQSDPDRTPSESQNAVKALAGAIAAAGRGHTVTVHPYSTGSHAKVVVADNGQGRWHALIGSCNWLASDFSSFEASVRVRDPQFVGDLIARLAGLSRGRPGLWTDNAVSLTVLGRRVAGLPRGNGRTANMRLILAPDHAGLVLEARDKAQQRIFVLSHRLGIAARPLALLPILSAVSANDVDARAYYARPTGPLSGLAGADLIREFAGQGVMIRPVHTPRLHAKVLGWDDNALAITSFNWLSADPPDYVPASELGVLIETPRIADTFFRIFDNARID